MSSTTASSARFQSILEAAFDSYAKQTGVELAKHPSMHKLENCHSPDDVLQLLLEREIAFHDYRDKHRKLLDCLGPVVQVVHTFSAVFGEVAGFVPFQPTNAIFAGIDILLSAAIGVSSSYDALLELFGGVANFLQRLPIYPEKILLSSTMSDIIVQIMVEVLSVLALVTKQIKEGRLKKFAKMLLGKRDVEAILQRLDRLTQEETRMAAAHNLRVTLEVFNKLEVVMADGKASTDGVQKARGNRLKTDIRNWLSSPDPSINHNLARGIYHNGTASWFTESNKFKEWKSNGSLLWVHGKPGSGKSIFCSSIIEDLKRRRTMGLALLTYFYFNFNDSKKQNVNGLLVSLISQLTAKSNACYDILSALYDEYDDGLLLPDDDVLIDCLANMLKIEGQPTIYIIMDAIDECPNSPSVVSPRKRVLQFVEKLVNLQLPNVRICATSRPEADIRASLETLASHKVSLHDEPGQNKDISHYVRSFVYSDLNMRRWREEDKELVIDTLSQKANGMFRWTVCQLEALMKTFPWAIRRALDDLPQGLDETYDRILQSIPQAQQKIARRLFACLAKSFRSLCVEELAEILTIELDAGALPNHYMNWRMDDPEEAVLLICSSLITIVDVDGSRVVQFSHFSVKEYLTSERLANTKDLYQYHITPHFAHTVLAQASLGVLLALDYKVNKKMMKNHRFAIYAARYWVDHAQFENVSMGIHDAMKCLFDPSKPHFAAWMWIYDIDFPFREIMFTAHPTARKTVPLYYAILCGFRDIVKHLIVTRPQDINARGGNYTTPLHAAVVKGHIDITTLLAEHDADVNALNRDKLSPLHQATLKGDVEMIESLLRHQSDINAQSGGGGTALCLASMTGELDTARVLLHHGAIVDSHDDRGWNPLMSASKHGHPDIVRMLLENGATVESPNDAGWIPLMQASRYGHSDVVRMLLDNGTTVDSSDDDGWNSLMSASKYGHLGVVRTLLENGATMDTRDDDGWTPLLLASKFGHPDIVRVLLNNGGVTTESCNDAGWTSLMEASRYGHSDVVRILLDNGATVDSSDDNGWNSLMSASKYGHLGVVRMLLKNGATMDTRDNDGSTPLLLASKFGYPDIVRALLENGPTAESRNNASWTPLMEASLYGNSDVVRISLENGATVDSSDNNGWNSLMEASKYGYLGVVRRLLENGATVDPRDNDGWTPLLLASKFGYPDIVRALLEKGATTNSRNDAGWTPLMEASLYGNSDVVRILLDNGATADSSDNDGWNSLMSASKFGHLGIVRMLLENDATVDPHDNDGSTPLLLASKFGHPDIIRVLLENGVTAESRNDAGWTPLTVAPESQYEHLDVVRILLDNGAIVDSSDNNGWNSLMSASKYGHLGIVHILLENDATVDPHDNDGWTPLLLASKFGHADIVRVLLKNGATTESRNNAGWTPLMEASLYGNSDVVRLLLENGATVDSNDNNGWNSLMSASKDGHLGVVRMLLKNGATVDPHDNQGWTPLLLASKFGYPDIVRVLLKNGATAESRNNAGRTPLMEASLYGNSDVIRILLNDGVDLNSRGRNGALHAALSMDGDLDVVQILLDHGVDVNARDADDWCKVSVHVGFEMGQIVGAPKQPLRDLTAPQRTASSTSPPRRPTLSSPMISPCYTFETIFSDPLS